MKLGEPGELLVNSDLMVTSYLNKSEEAAESFMEIEGRKWYFKNLVAYKIPQYIEFRDMLPKSKIGKLLRREIRDEEKRRAEA